MIIRPYFQDLSERALQETQKIFKDTEHPKFVSRMVRLLSQCDKPKEVFNLVGRQGFLNAWPKILKYWKRTQAATDFRDWWQTIYERLLERDQAGRSPAGMPLKKLQIMGNKIMQARTAKGWTQQDLAQKARLKQPDVSAIEKGNKNLTIETLARLEQMLEIELFATEKVKKKDEQPADIEKQPFTFIDSQQSRIYADLFELISPGAADFYKDACRLLEPKSDFESKTLLIGHLFREIESAIRAILVSSFKIKPEDKNEDKHKHQIEEILKKLKIAGKEPWTKTWLRIADKKNTYTLSKLAHRDALSKPRDLSSETNLFFNEFQDFLEKILGETRRHFRHFFSDLDSLHSKSEPTEKDAKLLLNKIPNTPVTRGYFFERCNDKWLGLLKMQEVFKHPPAPVSLEDGTTTFPYWPEADYLARMASSKPEKVCEIIFKMPSTRNIAVINNLAEAVLAMPAALAVRLIDKIKLWTQTKYLGYTLTGKLGSLITHLASAGNVEQALDLTETLLEIQPDPKFQNRDKEDKRLWSEPQPQTRVNFYEYKEILEKSIPELVNLAGMQTLNLLCDLLEKSVTYSRYPGEDIGQRDSSYLWRPAIEPHEQNKHDSLQSILVDALRDTAAQLSRSLDISVLVNLLEANPYKIFKRLALHLLSRSTTALGLIEERLANRDLFDDVHCQHEYVLLMKNKFLEISQEKQQIILEWIEQGPDIKEYERRHGKRPTDEEAGQYCERWKRNHLAWIEPNLPEKWQGYYTELVKKYGEPEHIGFPYYSEGVQIGPTSPITRDELRIMPISAIVKYIKEWQPSGDLMDHSPRGLGRMLSAVAKDDPSRFTAEAAKFKDLDPTYVGEFLFGLEQAIREKKQNIKHWDQVMELCHWVINQPREIPGRQNQNFDSFHQDQDWGETRGVIADLIAAGLQYISTGILLNLRKKIWNILEPLTHDPDPTPEHERKYGEDPSSLSISSTRGRAMHAVIHYALWMRTHLEKRHDAQERLSRGFEEMPEVYRVLEKHLEISSDPSPAIRSVYGRWFAGLILLDPDWAQSNIGKIFPATESEQVFWKAAWDAYLIYGQFNPKVLKILSTEYFKAIDRLDQASEQEAKGLASHLIALYGHGEIDLSKEGHLARFWAKASDNIRNEALSSAGRVLNDSKPGEIPAQVIMRLKYLWEHRLEAAINTLNQDEFAEELAAFGWWFASGHFEEQWAFTQLLTVLKHTKKIEPMHFVIARLEPMAPKFPRETLQCLELITENDAKGYFVASHHDAIRKMLENILGRQDEKIREQAQEYISCLVSKDFVKFRELLL